MNIKGKLRIIFVTQLLFLFFMIIFLPTAVVIAEALPVAPRGFSKTVKVAWPTSGKLSYIDEDDNEAGYDYDYLMRIRQYTGWEIEFVRPSAGQSLNDFLLNTVVAGLKSGDIDIAGGMVYQDTSQKDPEGNDKFPYSMTADPYCSSYSALVTSKNNSNFYTFDDLVTKKISLGLLTRAANTNQQILTYCDIHGIDYEAIYYADEAKLSKDVKDGKIDFMVKRDFMVSDKYRIVSKYDYQPYYFVASKASPSVLEELNYALIEIETSTPEFKMNMYKKHFETTQQNIEFTAEEKAFIETVKAVPVYISPSIAPFQHLDAKGKLAGITPDLLALISKITGLTFEYNILDTNNSMPGELPKNLIMGAVPYDIALADKHGFMLSTPFVSVPMTLAANVKSKSKLPKDSVVAVVTNTPGLDYLSEYKEIKYYSNIKDCIDATDKGEVDFTYGNSYSVSYYGFQVNYRNLVAVPIQDSDKEFCLAVSKTSDRALIRIVNKALRSIDTSTIESIIAKSTQNYQQALSLRMLMVAYPVESVLISLSIVLIIGGLVLLIFYTKIKTAKTLVVNAQRYSKLSELSGEYLLEFDCKNNKLISTQNCADLFGIETVFVATPELELLKLLQSGVTDNKGEFETQLTLADGTKNWFRVYYNAIYDGAKCVTTIHKLVDIEADKMEKDILLEKSIKDDLTKLFKIGYFADTVTEKLMSGANGAFLIFDLDKFKDINDTQGHLIGDYVLIEVGKILLNAFRLEDLPARLGGDEFVVFMDGASLEQATERARLVLSEAKEIEIEGMTVTLSCGISYAVDSYNTAYSDADTALYQVKSKGGNDLRVYTENSKDVPFSPTDIK